MTLVFLYPREISEKLDLVRSLTLSQGHDVKELVMHPEESESVLKRIEILQQKNEIPEFFALSEISTPSTSISSRGYSLETYVNSLVKTFGGSPDIWKELFRKDGFIPTTLPTPDPSYEMKRAFQRLKDIEKFIKKRPSVILDIGSGKGYISRALSEIYPQSAIYAIEPKMKTPTGNFKLISYDDQGRIPLSDGSVDLILGLVLLHHINPESRIKLVKEISRVLSSDGLLIIREHDDISKDDPYFHRFIDLYHRGWYKVENEIPDPLYLMTRSQTQTLMNNSGLQSVGFSSYTDNNYQQLYYEAYAKEISKFSPSAHRTISPIPTFKPSSSSIFSSSATKPPLPFSSSSRSSTGSVFTPSTSTSIFGKPPSPSTTYNPFLRSSTGSVFSPSSSVPSSSTTKPSPWGAK